MKKTVFALFAVLLVLSLATCDLLDPPEAAKSFSEDGMVSLTINIDDGGTSRALNLTNARAEADYYEVVFKTSGNKYYQVAFTKASNVADDRKITIPAGDYTGATKAVMFAGVQSTSTLLAVGIISKVDALVIGTGDTATINSNTQTVTFKLTALRNGVNFANTGTGASSFKIMGPTTANDPAPGSGSVGDYSTASAGIAKTAKSDDEYPVFPIPAHGYDNTNNTGFGTVAGNIIGKYSVTIPNSAGVILQANWSVTTAAYTGGTGGTEDGVNITAANLHLDLVSKTPGSALDATQDFTFIVDVSGLSDDGLCAVSINAPVRAISSTATYEIGTPIVWNIRGGTNNTAPDGLGDDGGAILLAVGQYFEATLHINKPDNTVGTGDWVES